MSFSITTEYGLALGSIILMNIRTQAKKGGVGDESMGLDADIVNDQDNAALYQSSAQSTPLLVSKKRVLSEGSLAGIRLGEEPSSDKSPPDTPPYIVEGDT